MGHGALARHPWALLAFISAISFQGYAMLWMFFQIFLGPPTSKQPEATLRERWGLGLLAAPLIGAGVTPWWVAGAS